MNNTSSGVAQAGRQSYNVDARRRIRMRFTSIILAVLFLCAAAVAYAEKTKKNSIDRAEEACIEKNGSTAGMTNCAEKAYGMWDKEMNKNYNVLMKELSPEEKEILRNAQKKWIDYRDNEFKLIDAIYSKVEGTMYIPMHVEERIAIVKQRALKLGNHLELLREGR